MNESFWILCNCLNETIYLFSKSFLQCRVVGMLEPIPSSRSKGKETAWTDGLKLTAAGIPQVSHPSTNQNFAWHLRSGLHFVVQHKLWINNASLCQYATEPLTLNETSADNNKKTLSIMLVRKYLVLEVNKKFKVTMCMQLMKRMTENKTMSGGDVVFDCWLNRGRSDCGLVVDCKKYAEFMWVKWLEKSGTHH